MMYRNIADDEFTENVTTDLKYFVKDVIVGVGSCNSKSVLLFPPVNNYRRFLIHKICDEATDADLHHFSIGQGDERRTVVCFTKDLLRVPEEPTMGIDQYCLPSMPPVRHEEDKKWKVMAAIDIYRPPAARRLSAQKARAANPEPDKPKSKPRRPDIQVYVPRPKRLSAHGSDSAPSVTHTTPPPVGRKPSANVAAEAPAFQQSSEHPPDLAPSPLRNDTVTPTAMVTPSATCDISTPRRKSVDDNHIELCHNTDNNSETIYDGSTSLTRAINDPVVEAIGPGRYIDSSFHEFPPDSSSVVSSERVNEDLCSDDVVSDEKSGNTDNAALCFKPDQIDNVGVVPDAMESMELDSDTSDSKHHSRPLDDKKPNDSSYGAEIVVSYNRKKCEDSGRSHEEQNRKNRLILHGKVMSDVLVISDPDPVQDLTSLNIESPPKTLLTKKKIRKPKEIPSVPINEEEEPSNLDISKLSAEDCTWDMMFDENGDCLHPHLMEELTSKVGKVAIKSPRSDYKAFVTPRTEFQPHDEYSHVLELYNFSPEFKTQDLINIFSPYKDKGFEIKWVDDTHALGVFSSSIVAADVLSTNHPFVKTRPLHEATAESRVKARRSAEFLRPYRARPETCPALARRLVTGALGVRLKTAKQEREAEKVLLNQAREKKRLEARQKDDAWEGIVGGN